MHRSPNAATSSTATTERAIGSQAIGRPPVADQRSQVAPDPSSGRDVGYELFRRAIMSRDEDAWIEIGTRYRAMLIAWAGQCSAIGFTDEGCEDVADRALARAWAALSPARFAKFPNLATLMGYLRTCVTATAIDLARAQRVRERAYQKLELGEVTTPEQQVLEEIERADLWRVISDAIGSQQERTVLVESFQLDLPPRAILARHPSLFANIDEVYLAKRHLIGRLQRNPDVRRFLRSQFAQ